MRHWSFGGWTEWCRLSTSAMEFVVRHLGVPESDIRDCRLCWSAPLVQFRLWNGRRLTASDYDMVKAGY